MAAFTAILGCVLDTPVYVSSASLQQLEETRVISATEDMADPDGHTVSPTN